MSFKSVVTVTYSTSSGSRTETYPNKHEFRTLNDCLLSLDQSKVNISAMLQRRGVQLTSISAVCQPDD